MKQTKELFKELWIVSVDIEAMPGFEFNELIDSNDCNAPLPKYIGAWANVIIQSENINEVINILEIGLKEKNFSIKFVDKVENMYSLVENNEVNVDTIEEAKWLYS